MLREVLKLWPFVVVATVVIGAIVLFANVCASAAQRPVVINDQEFKPLILSDRLVVSPETFAPGDSIVVNNGVCNTSDIPLFVSYSFNLVPEPVSPARSAFLLMQGGIYLEPQQCEGVALRLHVPSHTPFGPYKLAIDVVTTGPQADQRQAAIMLSNVFEIVSRTTDQE